MGGRSASTLPERNVRPFGLGAGFLPQAFLALVVLASCNGQNASATGDQRLTVEQEMPRLPAEASAQVMREGRVFDDPAPLMSVQNALGPAPVVLPHGEHLFDALGSEVRLHTSEFWRLEAEHPGVFSLSEPDAPLGAIAPVVSFHRPVGLSEPALVGASLPGNSPAGWVAGIGMASWLDDVGQLTVEESGFSSLADRDVPWWDVVVDPEAGPTSSACDPTPCVRVLWAGSHDWLVARQGFPLRLYEIPDPAGPIVIAVTSRPEDGPSFLDRVEELLRTIELGRSRPHPLPMGTTSARRFIVPADETWRFTGVEGVTLKAREETIVVQRPGEVAFATVAGRLDGMTLDQSPAGATVSRVPFLIGVVRPHSSPSGEVISSADDLRSAIEAHAASVSEIGSEPVLGHSTDVIRFDSGGDPLLVLRGPFQEFDQRGASWPLHRYGRAWIFDGPNGPTALFISAATAELVQDTTRANLPTILRSLQLCGPGDQCDHDA